MKKVCLPLFVVSMVCAASSARAGFVGTYVDAVPVGFSLAGENTTSTGTISYGNGFAGSEWGFWTDASTLGFANAQNDNIFFSDNDVQHTTDILTTTVTGLSPSTIYDVYVVYGAFSGVYGVEAALNGGTLTYYTDTNATSTVTPAGGGSIAEYEALLPGTVTGATSFTVNAANSLAFGSGRTYYDGVDFKAIGVVPEPGSLTLLAGGLVGLALARRWSRRKHQNA